MPRNTILQTIAASSLQLGEAARSIHEHPELCYQETFASQLLAESLQQQGLAVEQPFGGLETAFRARIGQPGTGPVVAILAEYDALPEIGHACGHNLIAAAALGAGLGLAAIRDQLPGEVQIIGTPAEEGGGGKIRLIEAGAFAGLDAAMMFHPFDRNVLALDSLANYKLHMEFTVEETKQSGGLFGSSIFCSSIFCSSRDRPSALSAVLQTFNLVDNARLHFKDMTRVHGIITNGGQAFNIIPEKAACLWCVRTNDLAYLDTVADRVEQCARAAALATGTSVVIQRQRGYKNMLNNRPLALRFGQNLQQLGLGDWRENDPTSGTFSTDMGDVSYVVPAIHPYLAICNPGESLCHQHRFVALSRSPRGLDVMIKAAQCLALTAFDLLSDPALLQNVRQAFQQQIK